MTIVCNRCGSVKKPTKDHIIPQAMLRAMGITNNDAVNLQHLCYGCNQLKGSQLDPKNPKTMPLLMMYIDRWQQLYGMPRRKNVYVFRHLPVKHDCTTYIFGVHVPVVAREKKAELNKEQRAKWRTMRTGFSQ